MAGFEQDHLGHHHPAGGSDDPPSPSDQVRDRGLMERTFRLALIVGVVGIVIGLLGGFIHENGGRRMGYAYLTAFCFVFSLAAGAMAFVLLQHLMRAGWSVTVRRVAESMMATMPLMAVLFVPILVMVLSGSGAVFPWAQPVPPALEKIALEDARAAAETPAWMRSYSEVAAARASDPNAFTDGEAPAQAAATDAAPSDALVAGPVLAEDGRAILTSASGTEPMAAAATAAALALAPEDGGHSDADVHGDAHAGEHHDDGRPHHQHYDELTHAKRPYLNAWFFTLRWVIFFGIWIGVSRALWKWSTRQDQTGDPDYTRKAGALSAPSLLVFALTLTFAAFDLLMSLNPHWFSTMFGVYYFAGSMVGFLALLTITVSWLHRRGLLGQSVNTEHQHDLGKLMFSFVFFWGYIAFSQYMLIWYANIPEETLWYQTRGATGYGPDQNPWTWIALVLLFGHLFIPFAGLLSRHVKRREAAMVFWAGWLLLMHFIDLWWVVMPEFSQTSLMIGLPEIGFAVGLSALFLAMVTRQLGARALVPVRDPRLGEALRFQNF